MNPNKLEEFVTVLVFALVLGGAAMLAVMNLSGVPLIIAIIALTGLTIAAWQYLRRRFKRD